LRQIGGKFAMEVCHADHLASLVAEEGEEDKYISNTQAIVKGTRHCAKIKRFSRFPSVIYILLEDGHVKSLKKDILLANAYK
jgi:hypothetical protein